MSMTRKELEQYPDICAELEALRRGRSVVRDVVSASGDTFPFTKHKVVVEGGGFDPAVQSRIAVLQKQKVNMERFVEQLPNFRIRRIVTLRALEGCSWREVAAQMGKRCTESGVRMEYYRVFHDKKK